jgi:myo-inositol-1(or 4)-monophosphatase
MPPPFHVALIFTPPRRERQYGGEMTSVPTNQAALLELAEAIAREAGAGLRAAFARLDELRVDTKSTPTDPVSEADVATERRIRERLAEARPDDGILGEEDGDTAGSSGLRWVVDPLDGTVNFLFGIPQWCTSIAVEDAGGALAGVVHDAMRDECWSATRDGEARLNGVAIRRPERTELSLALVGTGFAYDAAVRARMADVAAALLPQVRDIRRNGSAALDLCWAAAGRYDAYYEWGLKPWDIAAGGLIAARAGLAVRDLAPLTPEHLGFLVAPPALADRLQPLVDVAA